MTGRCLTRWFWFPVPRKRRGGIHLKENEPKTSSPADKSSSDSDSVEEGEGEEEEEGEREEGEKAARIDDLWASFKEETGLKTRQTPTKARCSDVWQHVRMVSRLHLSSAVDKFSAPCKGQSGDKVKEICPILELQGKNPCIG